MKKDQKEKLYDSFKILFEAELTIARLYEECARLWPKEKEFWLQLVEEEKGHATILVKIEKLVSERPDIVRPGKKFDFKEIQDFLAAVVSGIEHLKAGELTHKEALDIANVVENSAVELNYFQLIESDDEEITRMLNQVHQDTVRHRELIEKASKETP